MLEVPLLCRITTTSSNMTDNKSSSLKLGTSSERGTKETYIKSVAISEIDFDDFSNDFPRFKNEIAASLLSSVKGSFIQGNDDDESVIGDEADSILGDFLISFANEENQEEIRSVLKPNFKKAIFAIVEKQAQDGIRTEAEKNMFLEDKFSKEQQNQLAELQAKLFEAAMKKNEVVQERSSSDYSFSSDEENPSLSINNSNLIKGSARGENPYACKISEKLEEISEEHSAKIQALKTGLRKIEQSNFVSKYPTPSEEARMKPFRFKEIKNDLFNLLKVRFGNIACIGLANSGNLLGVSFTSKKFILGYFPEGKGLFEFKEFKIDNMDVPSCLIFEEHLNYLYIGYVSGGIAVYKYDPVEVKLNLFCKVKDASNSEVLQIASIGHHMEALILLDTECRLMLSLKSIRDGTMQLDFNLIELLKRDTIPQMDIFRGAYHDYIAVTAGDVLYAFSYSRKKNGELKKHMEMPIEHGWASESIVKFGSFQFSKKGFFYYLAVTTRAGLTIYRIIVDKRKHKVTILPWSNLAIEGGLLFVSIFEHSIVSFFDNKGKFYYYYIENHYAAKKEENDNLGGLNEDMSTRATSLSFMSNALSMFDVNMPNFDISDSELPTPEKSLFDDDFVEIKTEGIDLSTLLQWRSENGRVSSRSRYIFSNNSQILFVTSSSFCKFEMMNWAEYLNLSLEAKEFNFCLKKINQILEGKVDTLRNIPTDKFELLEQMQPHLEVLFSKMIPRVNRQSQDEVRFFVEHGINILVKSGMQEYLFNEYRDIMEAFNFRDEYCKEVKSIYEAQRINVNLPKDIIIEIFTAIKNEELERQTFVLALFERGGGFENLINQTIAGKDYPLLFHIVPKFDPELVLIPLQVIKNEFKEDERESNINWMIIQFWYVSQIFRLKQGHDIVTLRGHIWHTLCWLFDEISINDCLNIDCNTYLECIFILLKQGLANIISSEIEKWDGAEMMRLKPAEDHNILSASSVRNLPHLFNIIYSKLKNTNRLNFNLFIVSVLLENLEGVIISDEYIVQTVKDLIDSITDLPADLEVEHNVYKIMYKLFSLYLLRKGTTFADEDIVVRLEKGHKVLQLLFNELKGNHIETLKIFERLNSTYPPMKMLMFDWLEQGLKSVRDRESIISLMNSEYTYLINEDQNLFAELLKLLKIEEQMDFVLKYKDISRSKMIMLDRIILFVREKHRENELSDEFKIEYIKLLNAFHKRRVFEELQTGKYPTSECLKLCEDAKNQIAVAYLKERLGFYSEALAIYKARLKKIIKALVKGKRYFEDSRRKERLLWRLKSESDMVLAMCKEADSHQKLLFEYFNNMVILDNKYDTIFVPEIKSTTESFLFFILESVAKDKFISKIGEEGYAFFLNRELVAKTLNHFKGLRAIVSSCLEITIRDQYEKDNNGAIMMLKGTKKKVINLNSKYSEDSRVIFQSCDHNFAVMRKEIRSKRLFCPDCEQNEKIKACKVWQRGRLQEKDPVYANEFQTKIKRFNTIKNVEIEESRKKLNLLDVFDNCVSRRDVYLMEEVDLI